MNRRWVVGILVVLLLIVGADTVGGYAYSAGVSRGLADSGKLIVPQGGGVPFAYGAPYFYPEPWGFGFGFLRCVFPLLGFFLVFALLRAFLWRGRWGGRHGWAGHGNGPGGQGVPPMFDEWHRRSHGGPEPKAEGTGQ